MLRIKRLITRKCKENVQRIFNNRLLKKWVAKKSRKKEIIYWDLSSFRKSKLVLDWVWGLFSKAN